MYMERKPGHSSLTVPYCLIKVKDSNQKDWVLQATELPPDYERECVAMAPFVFTATMNNNGRELVMVNYREPTFGYRFKSLLTKRKDWNDPPRELLDIFVNKTIGTREQLEEYERVEKALRDSPPPYRSKAYNDLIDKNLKLQDECFDSGAVNFKFGKISNDGIKAILESKELKKVLAKWDGSIRKSATSYCISGEETASGVGND
jgi:hypothetical protein